MRTFIRLTYVLLYFASLCLFFSFKPTDKPGNSFTQETRLEESIASHPLETMVLYMCQFIPDHGLRDEAEFHLTRSYFNAYSEAWKAPYAFYSNSADHEALLYFVCYDDGEPIFSVKSIQEDEGTIFAEVYIEIGNWGIPWESSEKTVHTLKLVRDPNSITEHYLIDDFDNTKQVCLDFIKSIREEYKNGTIEQNLREEGEDIDDFKEQLKEYYEKYGDE